jgi:hypothetical protein
MGLYGFFIILMVIIIIIRLLVFKPVVVPIELELIIITTLVFLRKSSNDLSTGTFS